MLALLLGGGQGSLGDTVVQLAGVLLLATVAVRYLASRMEFQGWPRSAWPILLVLAVPLLQWIPLPEYVARQALGAERALWTLLPACAIYLSVLGLPPARHRLLFAIVWILCVASLMLGLLQLAQGHDSSLRLYEITNREQAVGFFANRNHLAALFLLSLPFSFAAIALAVHRRRAAPGLAGVKIAAGVFVAMLLVFGIVVTRSRAGVLLGGLGVMLSVAMMFSLRPLGRLKRGHVLIAAIVASVLLALAGVSVLDRVGDDPLRDDRWTLGRKTIQTAVAAGPMGTGLGTFRQVYHVAERDTPGRFNANHAHNDYLELWLEAGWPFLLVLAGFLTLFARQSFAAWRAADRIESLWPKAASIAVLLMLLHSALDYPLRTTSIEAVFALALAILFAWRAPKANQGAD